MKKIIALCILVFCLEPSFGMQISANAQVKKESTYEADKIILKTRWYNGVLQKRHWNVTKNCWVEPYWTNVWTFLLLTAFLHSLYGLNITSWAACPGGGGACPVSVRLWKDVRSP